MIDMTDKKMMKRSVRYLLILAVGLVLGLGSIGYMPGQPVVAEAASGTAGEVVTAEQIDPGETAETTVTAETDNDSAVLILVMGGGLIIILAVVISVVSTVVSTIGAVAGGDE